MSVYILLDILLLILVALFVPIGFWRGAQREAFVTLGILFGAALSDWWARPWGNDLAAVTSLRDTAGAFMVAMLFLICGTFLLGYSAGSAIPLMPLGIVSRTLGGLIAAANGALLLSLALRNIRIYLLTDQDSGFLDNSLVADFLSTGSGWILMAGVVIFLPVVLGLVLFGRTIEIADYGDADEDYEAGYTPTPRRYPPRVSAPPVEPDRTAYKTESPSARYQASQETRPLAVPASSRERDSIAQDRQPDPTDEHVVVARRPSNGSSDQETAPQPAARDEQAVEALQAGRCPNCHADVRDAEVYCPRCGRVL